MRGMTADRRLGAALRRAALAFLTCLLWPALSMGQSTSSILGTARDVSGGVLPGVLIEASSPAIIEGTKSATTDGAGQYRIIDLRPGTYTITFTLSGFRIVRQEGVVLDADESRTVNVELTLSGVTQTVTVSAAPPVVDVSTTQRVTSLDREVIDNLPLGNNIWELAQVIPGIDILANFTDSSQTSSVGGSQGVTQPFMIARGQAFNNVMADGMNVNGLEGSGVVQAYFNNAQFAQVTFSTSGATADRSSGAVTVNMIPREGGNRFSGDARVSYRPKPRDGWITDNEARLNAMGKTGTASLRYLSDETISQGGPIIRNGLWFFGSYHQFNTSNNVDGTLFDDGSQAYSDQWNKQAVVRLTWQAAPRHKLSGSYERTNQLISHQMVAGTDPETASTRRTTPDYSVLAVKLTSTLTNRFLLEGGISFNREFRNEFGQPGVKKERGTPEWYASASRFTTGARTTAPGIFQQSWPDRYNYQASVTNVTGGHQIKAGGQWQWGRIFRSREANADLSQQYDQQTLVGAERVLSVPDNVVVANTPTSSKLRLNKDVAMYVQDSWRVRGLTLNVGLRWEHVNASVDPWSAPEGRFVPRRDVPGLYNIPDVYDWAPRLTAVYDLFGNSRTAIKYGWNRFNRGLATSIANSADVLGLQTATLNWEDANGDDIAQGGRTFIYNADGTVTPVNCVFGTPGCEIDMTGLDPTGRVFGTPAAQDQYQGFPRTWVMEHLIEVQHALTRRVSVTGSWVRSSAHDLTKTVNLLVQEGDYVPMRIYNPIDGTPITLWSVKDSATRARLRTADSSLTYVEPLRRNIYQQWSFEYRARLFPGASIFGGLTMERTDDKNCGSSVPGVVVAPTTLRFCDDWALDGIDDNGVFEQPSGPADPGWRLPWAADFRTSVSMPLPWYGITVGVTYLNNDVGTVSPFYSIVPGTGATGTRYPDGLSTPGSASATRKTAGQPTPACPTAYGCVPGAFVIPSACTTSCQPGQYVNLGAAATTAVTFALNPVGRIRKERLQQVDLRISKSFRARAGARNVSILPTFEAYNIFNANTIFGHQSASYAVNSGVYLIPSGTLSPRIIGFGAQVRW